MLAGRDLKYFPMKKLIALLLIYFSLSGTSFAHNLWIEVEGSGKVGEAQVIKVFYGEYTYDYYETIDGNFRDVEDFALYVIGPDGNRKQLNTTQGGNNFYKATFTPRENGTYRFVLISNKAEVVDWTAYELGILKPNFYAFAQQIIGYETSDLQQVNSSETPLSLDVQKMGASNDSVKVSTYFRGEPLAEKEVIITIADQWAKTIYTNGDGEATLNLHWDKQYVIEVVHTENTPGSFKGKEYEAIRHTVTFTLMADN